MAHAPIAHGAMLMKRPCITMLPSGQALSVCRSSMWHALGSALHLHLPPSPPPPPPPPWRHQWHQCAGARAGCTGCQCPMMRLIEACKHARSSRTCPASTTSVEPDVAMSMAIACLSLATGRTKHTAACERSTAGLQRAARHCTIMPPGCN